ncbi:SCO family protein [Shewanella cyperi]|uniref:SCO family protein n=1 Tax=Shewanella cyperi TaxID=2814292 RepID=UPI001A93B3A8|nr:SCO family protein [Shewanella cyperi]QSX42448.1 SCO family protein [Shewanella cyperi]
MHTDDTQTKVLALAVKSRLGLVSALIALALFGLLALLAPATTNIKPRLAQGYWLQPPKPLPDFSLTDHNGLKFNKTSLMGNWHILAYGYTSCPDVCPTTMLTLGALSKKLRNLDALKQPDFIFYTVDPLRDTEARLSDYVHFFEQGFGTKLMGLRTADINQQLSFEHFLGIKSSIEIKDINTQNITSTGFNDQYSVSHGMTLYVINPKAELSAVLMPTTNALGTSSFNLETLYQDFKTIIDALSITQ